MRIYCGKCKYGWINFWEYKECWKFEKRLDSDITKYTAIREKDAMKYNPAGNCGYYKSCNLIQKIKDSIKYLIQRI